MTRSSMLEVWRQDFVRTARAKGLRESAVILRHSLRAALIPVVTVLGLQFGGALAGAIVTESVFAWPGVGTFVLDAIYKRDYPVVQAAVLVVATVYILTNLAVDFLYVVLDPRIREP
jgi:peptide/nickel transport system permease protein